MVVLSVLVALALIWAMIYWRVPLLVWTVAIAVLGWLGMQALGATPTTQFVIGALYLLAALPVPPVRLPARPAIHVRYRT
jgi:hypothetical protein